jgi:ATP-dependent RNA helicase DDX54/DBP10
MFLIDDGLMCCSLDVDTKVSQNLQLSFLTVRTEQKQAALIHLLKDRIPAGQQTLVFASTRHHVELLQQLLALAHIQVTAVYGQLDATARKINIAKFRARQANVMVVTDLAARGIGK